MTTLIAAIAVVGLCVFGMCFNIVFRRKDFPEYEVSKNEEMRKIGIKCLHEQEREALAEGEPKKRRSSCSGTYTDECAGCGFYNNETKEI